jgi:hypothetical protein
MSRSRRGRSWCRELATSPQRCGARRAPAALLERASCFRVPALGRGPGWRGPAGRGSRATGSPSPGSRSDLARSSSERTRSQGDVSVHRRVGGSRAGPSSSLLRSAQRVRTRRRCSRAALTRLPGASRNTGGGNARLPRHGKAAPPRRALRTPRPRANRRRPLGAGSPALGGGSPRFGAHGRAPDLGRGSAHSVESVPSDRRRAWLRSSGPDAR